MDPRCRIELLGGLSVRQGDRVITRFRMQKIGGLLAYLAYYADRPHPREMLIELLWPECDLDAGRNRLSMSLSSLRNQLEPPGVPAGTVIQADQISVQLNPAAITTGVADFEAARRAAAQAGSAAERVQALTRAAELYRGPLLPGHYEEWALSEQQRLAEASLQVLRELAADLERLGDLPRALETARAAVSADPLREESHRELMRLCAAAGEPEAALRQYRELERILAGELGSSPAPATRLISQQIALGRGDEQAERARAQQGGRRAVKHKAPAGVRDARLTHPPPPPPLASRLPLQLNRFFGRHAELERLTEMLAPGEPSAGGDGASEQVGPVPQHRTPHTENRLVTLTGPGGTGKTRLALEATGRLVEAFQGAVWFVPLGEVSDARRLPDAILEALRISRAASTESLDQAIAALSQRPTLQVLDNLEHLLDGGAAALVQDLLQQAPGLAVLSTSRQSLDLPGERESPVAPLPVPSIGEGLEPAALAGNESVQLFVDRAQAVRPDFQVTRRNAAAIAELCDRLEGIPLAIELAAARSQVLTPARMLSQILPSPARGREGGGVARRLDLLIGRRRGVAERHRTLRAALDWSYHLLSPELRHFFARLSVFRGGWTLEAAEAIADDPLTRVPRLRIVRNRTAWGVEWTPSMKLHQSPTRKPLSSPNPQSAIRNPQWMPLTPWPSSATAP